MDGCELSDLDGGAVVEVEGGVGRDLGAVKNGAVGGVEVSEDPLARFGEDGEVLGGDASVLDEGLEEMSNSAPSHQPSSSHRQYLEQQHGLRRCCCTSLLLDPWP